MNRILVDWGSDFIRLVGSLRPALKCNAADVGEGESGMWVILMDDASVFVILGSRISISGAAPGNLDFVAVLTLVGLSLTILA